MQIYIMRHGEAENIVIEDSQRPLTTQGKLEADKMGHWLSTRSLLLTNIFVSPFLRAQQTCVNVVAAIKKSEHGLDTLPETLNMITPSGSASQVHDYIDGILQTAESLNKENEISESQAILLISHMPFISYLVAELTGSVKTPIFSTGTIAVIDYDIEKMQGYLVEMISPDTAST